VLTAADIIRLLDLAPHPEGGHFRETFRDDPPASADMRAAPAARRAASTAIYFLSAFRDWAAETTSYPSEAVEMSLAHTVGSAVENAYRRTNLLAKRASLMTEWAAFCTSAMQPAEAIDRAVAAVAVSHAAVQP
jgi:hypothetical protein